MIGISDFKEAANACQKSQQKHKTNVRVIAPKMNQNVNNSFLVYLSVLIFLVLNNF